MVVSLLQIIIELPESCTLKEKRRIVHSMRDKLQSRYKLSCAEVDLHESVLFSQLGAALVSNSKEHGEKVLYKAFEFVEDNIPGRIQDFKIISEIY